MTSAQSSPASPERRTLPADFLRMLDRHPALSGLADALATSAPEVSVRLNPAKPVGTPTWGVRGEPVPWCENGLYLPERPKFTLDPHLHQGRYYVQDASSMVMEHIARQLTADNAPIRWLDVCAAPGGKTTAAIAALPAGSAVVANEFDPKRVNALTENLLRWGAPNVAVTRGDTANLGRLTEMFDIVAVDAPCSGEGMMRKEAVAVSQWSPGLVVQCAALQREILTNVWGALKPGGTLVYSTCTFNTSENEENLRWIVDTFGAEPIDLGLTDFPGVVGPIVGNLPAARFLPGRIRGEGLFVCAVRKPLTPSPMAKKPSKNKRQTKPIKGSFTNWVTGNMVFTASKDGTVSAIPAHMADLVERVASECRLVTAGMEIATPKGRDYAPTAALARSLAYNPETFPAVEIPLETALVYLRGQAIAVDAPKGIIALAYDGLPLGFANNLGPRANNLLPSHLRIHH